MSEIVDRAGAGEPGARPAAGARSCPTGPGHGEPRSGPEALRDVIVFDGLCDLCNTGAAWLRERDQEGRFEFLPYQAAETGGRFPDLEPAALAAEMHVVTTEGRVLRGVDAGAHVLRALPGWRWLGRALASPWAGWAARPAYRWLARRRRGLPGAGLLAGTRGCKVGPS